MKLDPSDQLTAIARISRTAELLAETADPESAIVAAGFRAWLHGEVDDLAEALGVGRAPGRCDPRTLLSLHRRDAAVRQAVRAWGGVDAFIRALNRYRSTAWLRDRVERDCPPRLANKPEALLWRILRERDRDLSRSAVYKIVSNAAGSK